MQDDVPLTQPLQASSGFVLAARTRPAPPAPAALLPGNKGLNPTRQNIPGPLTVQLPQNKGKLRQK